MRVIVTLFILTGFLFSSASAAEFTLTSTDIQSGEHLSAKHVFNGFGCAGENIPPSLQWKNVPAGTKSFAVTMYDPDAPTGSGWWHWVVFNIPATVRSLPVFSKDTNGYALPAAAVQSRTDFGTVGFGGACPPQGDKAHRYQITVYALDIEHLDLAEDSPAALVGFFLHQHVIAKAQITAKYSR